MFGNVLIGLQYRGGNRARTRYVEPDDAETERGFDAIAHRRELQANPYRLQTRLRIVPPDYGVSATRLDMYHVTPSNRFHIAMLGRGNDQALAYFDPKHVPTLCGMMREAIATQTLAPLIGIVDAVRDCDHWIATLVQRWFDAAQYVPPAAPLRRKLPPSMFDGI